MRSNILAVLIVSISVVAFELADSSHYTQADPTITIARINETPNRHDASGHKNI